jgi:ubiquinone/menaquinone biosynthesis C-methylase UbiE
MAAAAKDWDLAQEHAVAPAAQLPFADQCFEPAAACNVLMDVEEAPAALQEARRNADHFDRASGL